MTDKKAHSLNRVVDIAISAYIRGKMRDMSINDIARLARCSTATIYEAFGSKNNLLRIAAEASISRQPYPRVDEDEINGLPGLLTFCVTRMEHLWNADRAETERLLRSQFHLTEDIVRRFVASEFEYLINILSKVVDHLISADLLRDFCPSVIVHNIMSGTGYFPMTAVNFLEEEKEDISSILYKTFLPLVSPKGRAVLDAFVTDLERKSASAGADRLPNRLMTSSLNEKVRLDS